VLQPSVGHSQKLPGLKYQGQLCRMADVWLWHTVFFMGILSPALRTHDTIALFSGCTLITMLALVLLGY